MNATTPATDWGASDSNAIVQPAFYFQDYQRGNYFRLQTGYGPDWLYPSGTPCWAVRFAPTSVGPWQYKIRVTDSQGTVTYVPPSNTFNCTVSTSHGFVQVSSADHRYFCTSDGTYLNFCGTENPGYMVNGVNVGSGTTYDEDVAYPFYSQNGWNLLRLWWNATNSPALFGISGQGGVYDWTDGAGSGQNVVIGYGAVAKPGQLFCADIAGSNDVSTSIDVMPATAYLISADVKTVGLGSGRAYLIANNIAEYTPGVAQPLNMNISPLTGDNDWTHLTTLVHTLSGAYQIPNANVEVAGAPSTSNVYVTNFSVKQQNSNGSLGPELVLMPNFDSEMNYSQCQMWRADYQTECARQNGIYLKIALGEKLDKEFSGIQADGASGAYDSSNLLFYGWKTYASRVYQQYFWRYIIARYGYATSIHSFELTNEGDPYNGAHYDATEAMANYFNTHDPNKHMAVTSLWDGFPVGQFWQDTADYPDIPYADRHTHAGEKTGVNIQFLYPGWLGDISPFIDRTTYHSAPASLHMSAATANNRIAISTDQFPVTPGHTYTLKWWMKGTNVTPMAGTQGGPYMSIVFYTGYNSGELNATGTGPLSANWTPTGTYDWTQAGSAPFTVGVDQNPNEPTYNGKPYTYLLLYCVLDHASGDVWFDDISLYDQTAQTVVEVPNGGLDENRCDQDTAMYNYAQGWTVGYGTARQLRKPFMDPNADVVSNQVTGLAYPFGYEDPYLTQDSNGIWYRKALWAQTSHFAVQTLWYTDNNIMAYGLYRYAKAHQSFMANIPLCNGNYVKADASVIDQSTGNPSTKVRAWGQKDLTNHRCHLWIDHKDSYWYNVVVNSAAVAQVTANVSVDMQDMRGGVPYTVEFFDTQSGQSGQAMNPKLTNQMLNNGVLTFQVTLAADSTNSAGNYQVNSDVGVKIYPTNLANISVNISVPSTGVKPGAKVTATVAFTNNGDTDATNVTVPAGIASTMTYVPGSATCTSGIPGETVTYDPINSVVEWSFPDLPVHQPCSETFIATVQ